MGHGAWFLYCSQLWSPRYLKDIKRIETIQRRVTKLILPSSILSYKERLLELNLLPLMYLYDLNDILFLAKCILHPPDNFDIFQFVSFCSHPTRSCSEGKLQVKFKRISTIHHFFFNRVVKLWNKVPSWCLDLTLSFPSIKARLSDHFYNHFLNHFNPDSICSYHFVCPCPNCFYL